MLDMRIVVCDPMSAGHLPIREIIAARENTRALAWVSRARVRCNTGDWMLSYPASCLRRKGEILPGGIEVCRAQALLPQECPGMVER